MPIWSKLFGADNIVEMVKDTGDVIVFTPEEKARHYIEVLKHIEPFKIAQRWLAVVVVVPYVTVWLLCAICFVLSVFLDGPISQQLILMTDKLAERNQDNLGNPSALILGFYFAGGTVEGIISKMKSK